MQLRWLLVSLIAACFSTAAPPPANTTGSGAGASASRDEVATRAVVALAGGDSQSLIGLSRGLPEHCDRSLRDVTDATHRVHATWTP
jgi:hypothetical protein